MAALVEETPADWGRVVVTPPLLGGVGGGGLVVGGGLVPQGRHWLYHSLERTQHAPETQVVEPV